MRQSGKIYILSLFFCICSIYAVQAQKLWSQVRMDRSSTYVGQPVEVSIFVYTSTWFTSGIDPGNIKVDGAFTTYFRPVSVSLQQGRTTYPGVQLIYHVFPFEEKDIVFPSLTLEVETPPEGDFKGVRRKLKTKERLIKVRPIPPGFSKADWLVTISLEVYDHWSKPLNNIKVGDVLERRITRTAFGTVAELIPPMAWDSLKGVSMYPRRSDVKNHKTKTSISASRTETMRYLFEKEGEIMLPEMVFTWYHPYQKRLYKRTLKGVTIHVAANPNLGVLESIRDSLQIQQQVETEASEEDKPFTILGLSPKIFAVLCVVGAILLYVFIKFLMYFIRKMKARRQAYLNSEKYYFDQFMKVFSQPEKATAACYRWLDELQLKESSMDYFIQKYAILTFHKTVLGQGTTPEKLPKRNWKQAREIYLKRKKNVKSNKYWINP